MSSDLSNEKKHAGGQIIVVMVIFFLLMVVVTAWAVYYAIANRVELFNNDSNPRETLLAERIDRGTIYAADGSVLAENDESGTRVYPYGRVFAHVVGYSAMGGSGIEEYSKYDLLHSNIPFMEKVECDKEGVKYPGDNITTTLVPKLQQAAYDAMGYYEGAIIVTEVRTGKILAMVSKPDYDPAYIERDWNFYLEEDDEGTLVNRATQGQYPPGSTFKIVDVVELLQEHPDADTTYHFSCSGSFSQDGESITCYDHDVHGEEDLTAAFANSCNSAFASIGLSLDRKDYIATLKRLMFNGKLPYDLPYNTSKLNLTTDISTREMIQVSIGQGTTQMSPLHLNMI
ncbi:MAG: penicillin-binding protein 2, partial [Lachnospiraceae bacterium]|nr:penicillin-binding protein 2 [Lachnospiraceae bacterium]